MLIYYVIEPNDCDILFFFNVALQFINKKCDPSSISITFVWAALNQDLFEL